MLIASGIFIAQRLNSRNQQSFPNYMTMMCHLHCWSPQCLQEMLQIDFNIAFMLARVVLMSCLFRGIAWQGETASRIQKRHLYIDTWSYISSSVLIDPRQTGLVSKRTMQSFNCINVTTWSILPKCPSYSALWHGYVSRRKRSSFRCVWSSIRSSWGMQKFQVNSKRPPKNNLFWTNLSKNCKNCQFCVFMKMFTITIPWVCMTWFRWITSRKG